MHIYIAHFNKYFLSVTCRTE